MQSANCYFKISNKSRFEHCLGTAHLCGKLIDTLKKSEEKKPKRKRIKITKEESLCVKIAGLCHDLGHGPFSHFFDGVFIPYMIENKKIPGPAWKHEDASCKLFELMVKSNDGVDKKFNDKFGSEKDKYINFIKDLMLGL